MEDTTIIHLLNTATLSKKNKQTAFYPTYI